MSFSDRDLRETTVSRRDVFSGYIFRVHVDDIELPNGSASVREVVDHNGGVCVAAFNDKGEVAIVRQFRYAYGETLPELPAGKLEKGENPDEAIRRELSEEVGAEGENWKSMGLFYPTPGYVNEIIRLYSCDICAMGEQHPDEDEFLNLEFISLQKAVELVMSGEIRDGKSQALILKCAIDRGLYTDSSSGR